MGHKELIDFMETEGFNLIEWIEDNHLNMESVFFIFNSTELNLSVCVEYNKDFEDYEIFEICSINDSIPMADFYSYRNFKLVPSYYSGSTVTEFEHKFREWKNNYIEFFKEIIDTLNETNVQSYEITDEVFSCAKSDAFSQFRQSSRHYYEDEMGSATNMYMYLKNKSKNTNTYTLDYINAIETFIQMVIEKGIEEDYGFEIDGEYIDEIIPPCLIVINRMEILLEKQINILTNTVI